LIEAEGILKRHYSSGEITAEEFAHKKKDLGIRDGHALIGRPAQSIKSSSPGVFTAWLKS
jgi:hypothetical protein